MAKRDDTVTLSEIAENIALIRQFLVGHEHSTFEKDRRTLYAVVRALEIISEAARRLSQELKNRHVGIPWRNVEDAGNHYRHVYHSLQSQVIWDTAHKPLDDLLEVVEAELSRPPEV